jgi:RNA polymerase sigma-70 factor (ECF subfamily)
MASEPTIDQEFEAELLRRVGDGDRQSFEDLYDRISGVLFAAAMQILNDEREAEDVIQEVFIQIWEKAKLYKVAKGKPLTWAMTLTRNRSIDRLRSVQRRFRLQDQVECESRVTDHTVPAGSIDALEKSRIIRSAVLRLSKEQREAIELAFFSGLTQNEIAQELAQPIGTVKARIRRGVRRLKGLVGWRF